MKNQKFFIVAITIMSLLNSSCSKEQIQIGGTGSIITKTLQVEAFTMINIEGVDDVIISYGTKQEVKVTGHPNIISRIETEVTNGTWNIELEEGNYGEYELKYYLTLPALERITSNGTGNVIVTDFISQDNLSIKLIGTGNFHGFPMIIKNCSVDISGTGNCEVSVEAKLAASIIGSGSVFYKGDPSTSTNISGSGSVIKMNN